MAKIESFSLISLSRLDEVAQDTNPGYSGGGDWEDYSSRRA
jgi:hypothetical protein